MSKPKSTLSIKILKRALSDEQFDKLMDGYEKAKSSDKEFPFYWKPSAKDWELWDKNPRANLSEWKNRWNVVKQTALRRLGMMFLLEPRREEQQLFEEEKELERKE